MSSRTGLLETGQIMVEEKVEKLNGDTAIHKYIKGRFLGKGGFAKCYEFTDTESKRICAAKIIDKSTLAKSRAKQKVRSYLIFS